MVTVFQRAGLFIAICLLLWGMAVGLGFAAVPDHMSHTVQAAFLALLICLIPTSATLLWSGLAAPQDINKQMMIVFGSTGVRMIFVLAVGFLLAKTYPPVKDHARVYWFWVIGCYLVTLGLEVYFLLQIQKKSKPQQETQNSAETVAVSSDVSS